MNPDKRKVGCLVPYCAAKWCSRSRKKHCALRKYFLEYQAEVRRVLSRIPEQKKKYADYWKNK